MYAPRKKEQDQTCIGLVVEMRHLQDVYWAMEMLPDTELRLLAGQLKILGKKFIQQLAEKYVHLFLVMRQLVLAQSVQLSRIINPAV